MQRPRMTKPNDIPKLLTIADLSVRRDMPRQSLHDKKRRGQIPSPRTICREQSDGTLPRKRHHRIRKRESVHQDESTTGSATEFHLQVVYGRERRIKKWHISCHFRTFDDITETPGSAWAITESDSSFPLCSLNQLQNKKHKNINIWNLSNQAYISFQLLVLPRPIQFQKIISGIIS